MDARNASAALEARSIVTSRLIDAPRALVFEAWTHPNHLSHWFGPDGFSLTTKAFEFRVGGVWRFVMHGPDGRDYQNRVTFDEIVAPERLRYHHGGADDVEPVMFDMTVTFEDIGGKTRLTLQHVFKTAEERDRNVREYGSVEGAEQTLGRLATYTADWKTTGGLEKTVTLSRLIKAPRALVFRCFTDAEHLARWWGPKGSINPSCKIDPRPGGILSILMEGPGFKHLMTSTIVEIVPNERFVFTGGPLDADGNPLLETHNSFTFRDEAGGTRVELVAQAKGLVPMARMMLAGMNQGWAEGLDRLAEEAERG